MKRPQRPFVLWVAALAVILLFLFHEALFGGKGLVPADETLAYPPWNDHSPPGNYLLVDQYAVFIPEHDFMHREVKEGRFPLWNPYLACGMPNPASIQTATWFPIQLLGSVLDPFYASGPAAFLKLFLAGLFTMLYLRVLGVSNAGSFLAGLVFSLCGFMIVWLGHPHVNCAMWLPLLLYFIEKSFRSSDQPTTISFSKSWAGFAVAYGLMLLGGHPPTAVHVSLFVFAYFLMRLVTSRATHPFRRLGMFIAFLLAGVMVAAVQIIPYLEYYAQSSSSVSSGIIQRWAYHLTPDMLVHFIFPFLTGSPADGFEDLSWLIGPPDTANFNERTAYAGILPLLFAAYGIFCRRDQFAIFFSGTIAIALLVVLGVPPIPMIMSHLPVLNAISNTRLLLLVAFSLAVLAGLGWDAFSIPGNRRRVIQVTVGFLILMGGSLGMVGWNVLAKIHLLQPAYKVYVFEQFLIPLGSLLVVAFIFLKLPSVGQRFRILLVAGWTTVDLLTFARGYNPAIPRDRYYPDAPAIQWLQQDKSVFRILGLGNTFYPDSAAVYGLQDARGIDYMTLRRYEELINGTAGNFWFYREAAQLPEPFRLLNIKYVLSSAPALQTNQDFELVFTNGVNIYRFRKYLPRALPVFDCQVKTKPEILAAVRQRTFDPAGTLLLEQKPETLPVTSSPVVLETNAAARIISYLPDEVKIEADMPRAGFLLLLDSYFPGWTASVNGGQAKIYRADYNFRAVILPAGKSSVTFSYQPRSFYFGLGISALALMVLVAVFIRPRRPPTDLPDQSA